MTDMAPDAELGAIVVQLEAAGLVETYSGADGKPSYRLTDKGAQIGRSTALAGDEGAAAVLEALLDASDRT